MELNALPVKRMVLYKHGVGFIERSGSIKNKKEIKLSFKKELMNDLLKSLLIFSKGKGKVTGISYETPEDISRVIDEKGIRVPEKEAMIGLFRKLKGYGVEIKTNTEKIIGRVLGTQEQPLPINQQLNIDMCKESEKSTVVIQDSEGGIRNIVIDKIVSYKILDPEAIEDLDFFLNAVTSERKKNVKAVRVFLDGLDTELNVSYIMQIPSWRVSYRLVYNGDSTMIQGWGIIDNHLDEDLKDVNMSLVAGKPISFIYDLYNPPVVRRPIIKEQLRGVSAPVELESGMEEYDEEIEADEETIKGEYDDMMFDEVMSSAAPHGSEKAMAMMRMRTPSSYISEEAFDYSDQTLDTKTTDMGEFFQYNITHPVTVKRGQSAMVPIIQKRIECKKEHVYNSNKMPRNPLVTMLVKNDTDLVLERGPVVVIDDDTYVGEAIIPYTVPNGENHIPYSVDMSVHVTEDVSIENEFKEIKIEEDYLYRNEYETLITEYKIENKNNKAVDLVLEQIKRRDYLLVDTKKPYEETENYYRWKFKVKEKSHIKFEVKEGKEISSTERISNMRMSTIELYLNEKYINKRTFSFIKGIIDIRLEVEKLENKLNELDKVRDSIFREQERIRKNLKSLSTSGEEEKLRKKYVMTLDKQETQLKDISKNKTSLKKLIESLKNKMDKQLTETIFKELEEKYFK